MGLINKSYRNPYKYSEIAKTADHGIIVAAVTSDKETEQSQAFYNKHLNDLEFDLLLNSKFPGVRGEIASSGRVTSDVLVKLSEDKNERVQAFALGENTIPFKVLKNKAMTKKFNRSNIWLILQNDYIGSDLELFKHLWNTYPKMRDELVNSVDYSPLSIAYENKHGADLTQVVIDSRIAHFIGPQILESDKKVRVAYADSDILSDPVILDQLKQDEFRDVINKIANNKNAWASTHDFIVSNHKTPSLRISVAINTQDKDLLNKIYNSTKSKNIRKVVEDNPNFWI